jgi:hypothetical protein
MPDQGVKLFLSCVSDEFAAYREDPQTILSSSLPSLTSAARWASRSECRVVGGGIVGVVVDPD